jgi:hypothetical protein
MIDHNGRVLVFSCDECPKWAEDDDDLGFALFWADLKREGWRAKKIGQDWVHACPACVMRPNARIYD